MVTSTLLSTGLLAQAVVPGERSGLHLGLVMAVVASLIVLALAARTVRAMAQAVGTLLRMVAPVFVAMAATGAVLVLAGVALAGRT